MKRSAFGLRSSRRTCEVAGALVAWAALVAGPAAQSPPPVTGTIALEGTMQKFYRAANVIIVKTIDGVEHALSFTKSLIVHGGPEGEDPLAGLVEGRPVVVHYTLQGTRLAAQEIDRVGADDTTITEGRVVEVNRKRRQITIRFDNGSLETLRLSERAAADSSTGVAEPGLNVQVKVLVVKEDGQRVVHYFRRIDQRSNQR
jgi:hypothetical protein